MKRRTKTKYTQIHVSIPVRLLEDFDELLAFKASRSKLISYLMQRYVSGDYDQSPIATTQQLMAMLHAREDVDSILKAYLLQVLSQKGE